MLKNLFTNSARNFLILGVVSALGVSTSTHAGEITISQAFDNGTQAASVTFVFNDDGASTTLAILLGNTMSATGPGSDPQVLSAIRFNLAGNPAMTYTGLGGDGSDSFNDMVTLTDNGPGNPDTKSAYTDVTADHFWALRQDFPAGQSYGLSGYSAGGSFGAGDVLNIQAGGPLPQPGEIDGGIIASGAIDLPLPLAGIPFVENGLWFTFDLGAYGFSELSVTDIEFFFGIDSDGDGVLDGDDNCPADPNPDQADRDLDGVGDVCDNCPDVFNPDQEDTNGDGIGDACSGPVDSDGDGVPDQADVCSGTAIPEGIPTRTLGVNRWALTDGDGIFDTAPPPGRGRGPDLDFMIEDTAGCSCEQIIEALDLGKGHLKHGCSISAMEAWVELVNP